jgi:hypothetical protein
MHRQQILRFYLTKDGRWHCRRQVSAHADSDLGVALFAPKKQHRQRGLEVERRKPTIPRSRNMIFAMCRSPREWASIHRANWRRSHSETKDRRRRPRAVRTSGRPLSRIAFSGDSRIARNVVSRTLAEQGRGCCTSTIRWSRARDLHDRRRLGGWPARPLPTIAAATSSSGAGVFVDSYRGRASGRVLAAHPPGHGRESSIARCAAMAMTVLGQSRRLRHGGALRQRVHRN